MPPTPPGAAQSAGDAPTPTPTQAPTPGSPWAHRLERFVDSFRRWGWVFLLVALAPGAAIWPLLHARELEFILTGKLDIDLRRQMLLGMIGVAGIVAAYYVVAHAWMRRRVSGLRFGDTALMLNRFTFVVIATPLLVALLVPGMETKHRSVTLVLITFCSIIFGVWLHRLLGLRPQRWTEPTARRSDKWPFVAAVGVFAFYAVFFSWLALLDHRNLGTHIYDLGIYDNIFWHNANGEFMGCSYCKTGKHMSSHFDPITWVFSPIYRLYQRAETILVLQVVWLATGVFPLYLLAKRQLQNGWFGVLLALVYVLYPALHGANMFDFHSLTMVIPSLLWAIYFIDSGAVWRFWLALALMLVSREDMSLLACFVGAYAMLRHRTMLGFLTIIVSLAYLTTIKMFVMNDPGLIMAGGQESTSFRHFYEEMIPHQEEGLKGLVITAVTNPAFALQVLFKDDKVFFFLALLLPTLFLPLVSGRKSVMMLYGLVFIGLASRPHMFSLHFQYSAVLFPVLIASIPDGLLTATRSRIPAAYGVRPRHLQWSLMGMAVFTTMLLSVKFGGLVPNESFKAGWNRINWRPDDEVRKRYVWVRDAIETHIPRDASVCASSSLGPHASNRDEAHKWPSTKNADFLLLESDLSKKSKQRLARLTRSGEYIKIAEGYGIEIYRRVPAEERVPEPGKGRSTRSKADVKEPSNEAAVDESGSGGEGEGDSENPRALPLGRNPSRADEADSEADDRDPNQEE